MIARRCATCTRRLPQLISSYKTTSATLLSPTTSTLCHGILVTPEYSAQNRRELLVQQYASPLLTVRFYSTEKSPPPSSSTSQIPIHLVNSKVDLTSTVKHIDDIPENTPEEEKEKGKKGKNEEVAKVAATDKTTVEEKKTSAVATVAKDAVVLSRTMRVWQSVKNGALHYYDGSRLLAIEVRISARLTKKIFAGTTLTRRERRQLSRTLGDLFRLVPLAVFVLIPFMELLLPVALYLFPNMLPSTFESIDKKKEKKLKKLKLKLDLAKFIQESMVSGITLQDGNPTELERFSEFIAKTRGKDPRDDVDELVSFSKLFSEEMTLDNLPRSYIVALCQLINITTTGHTLMFLRYRLRSRMKALKEDDRLIKKEGVTSLSPTELQTANIDRGMRAVGVSTQRLTQQLEQWLMLRLEKDIPMTLLLLSRVSTLPTGPLLSYEDLRNAVAHLPDSLIGEAKLSLASKAGEKIDNRSRLEAVKEQEKMIEEEKALQAKKEIKDQERDRQLEEQKLKEEANTRVAANLQMRKETLKDMAKPILTEDQEIRQQEVAEVLQLITGLRDKKNPLLEEKEELRDLIEKALIFHISAEDNSLKRSTGSKLLSNKVAKMLNQSHKVLSQLEKSLTADLTSASETDGSVLTKQEIKSAINEIFYVNKKEKLLSIVEVLSDLDDESINTSAVLKGLEKLATEGTDMRQKEIAAAIKLAKVKSSSSSSSSSSKSASSSSSKDDD